MPFEGPETTLHTHEITMSGVPVVDLSVDGDDVEISERPLSPSEQEAVEQHGKSDEAEIEIISGYDPTDIPEADFYVIGNSISRGNAALEELLNRKANLISGPQWLHDFILKNKPALSEEYIVHIEGNLNRSDELLFREKLDEKTVQGWRDAIPLKRGGTPEDIANACVFLGSDMSAYVTGQVLQVDGGMLT